MRLSMTKGSIPQGCEEILEEMPIETAREFRSGGTLPGSVCLAAFTEEGIPAGTALVQTEEGESTGYFQLFVRKNFRRKSIGSALAAQILKQAKKMGLSILCSNYRIDTEEERRTAERFAEQFGFQGQFVSRYMVYQGDFLPEPELEFVPYRGEYFDEMYQLISDAFYPMREANHLEPYRFTWGNAERREFSEHAEDFFLLFENGEMIASGYACDGEIDQVAVRADHRGKGLGRAVISHGVNKSLQEGFSEVFLYVLEWNRSAWSLYESLGFVTQGVHMFGEIDLQKPVPGAFPR